MWATRCVHEASCHESNLFVTLTYDDDHLPGPSLDYRDFQLFMKRLRKAKGPVRFFACGEYGSPEKGYRPHFHALLFGVGFHDAKKFNNTLSTSAHLEQLWGNGFAPFGLVNSTTAAYVARYTVKKVGGDQAAEHYSRVDPRSGEIVQCVPEFAHMSMRPGIGYEWFQKYWRDIYGARDAVILEGKEVPVPKYYDQLLERLDGIVRAEKELSRFEKFQELDPNESSPERLAVQETVVKARLNHYTKRNTQ